MSTKQILLSGFGGQGILFAGKMLAYKGLVAEKEVRCCNGKGSTLLGVYKQRSRHYKDKMVDISRLNNKLIASLMLLVVKTRKRFLCRRARFWAELFHRVFNINSAKIYLSVTKVANCDKLSKFFSRKVLLFLFIDI